MLEELLKPLAFADFSMWHELEAEHIVLSHRAAINLVPP